MSGLRFGLWWLVACGGGEPADGPTDGTSSPPTETGAPTVTDTPTAPPDPTGTTGHTGATTAPLVPPPFDADFLWATLTFDDAVDLGHAPAEVPAASRVEPGPVTLAEVAMSVGLEAGVAGGNSHGVGVGFFDADGDGWDDLLVASGFDNTRWHPSSLWRNRGDGTFEDVSEAAGVADVVHSMGANYGDFDNDGWPDYLLGTGEPDFRALVPNRAYRNDAGRGFQDVTTAGGFGHLQKGHGVSFGDLDNDGDQDVHVTMGGAYPGDWYFNSLYENPGAGGDNAWITLVLQGGAANRAAIGARVTVVTDDPAAPDGTRSIHGLVGSGGSFGANSLQLELGLGAATAIRRVEVRWPSGGVDAGVGGAATSAAAGDVEIFEGLEPRATYRLIQGEGRAERVERAAFDLTPGLADGEMPVYPAHDLGHMPAHDG